VQTRLREAVRPRELQAADRLTPRQHVADPHGGRHRFVRRACRAVVDHDDAAAREGSGEADPAREGGVDHLADRAGQVDAAMPGAPGGVGRVEGLHDPRLGLQRPHPDRNRGHGRADRAGGPREGDERGQDAGNDDQQPTAVAPDRMGE
jgi:hypothetical protein